MTSDDWQTQLSTGCAGADAWLLGLQVLALEALQLYAPMGHAMGLGQLSSSIEDICFQVHNSRMCSAVQLNLPRRNARDLQAGTATHVVLGQCVQL